MTVPRHETADPYQARRSSFALDNKHVRHNEWKQERLTEADSAASTVGTSWELLQNNFTPRCPCTGTGTTSTSSGDPLYRNKHCIEKPSLRRSNIMRKTENEMVLSEEVEHHLLTLR